MKCQAIQTCLLSLEQPEQPTPELAAHLGECLACRDWFQQLLLIERHVALLPVPPSSGKARLFEALRTVERETVRKPDFGVPNDAPVALPHPALRKPHANEPVWARHERRLKRLAVTSALAAALILVAVGLWIARFSHTPVEVVRPPAEDPLLASLLQRNLRLAAANSPRQRLEALADLADDLNSESQTLMQAASPTDLATLAQLYRKVVQEGIVAQAKALPPAERATALGPIADRLTRVWNDADELADRLPAGTSRSLRVIAAAARDGDKQLRGLLRGEKT